MQALVKVRSGPGLERLDQPIPKIAPDEVLIKIHSAAICGTDQHIYSWNDWAARTLSPPLIIGHEFMGEIAEVGSLVHHLKIGQRVSGEGHVSCGFCHNCRINKRHLCPNTQGIGIQRNGAFAEYLSLPAINVVPIPDFISDDIATIFDPLGNAVHSCLEVDLIGEDILITGAGPIGMMTSKIAKFIGAKATYITDINPFRLELAKRLGADHIINVAQHSLTEYLTTLDPKPEFRVGFEMAGKEKALQDQLLHLYPGAALALLGIPSHSIALDVNKIIFKGLTIKGIYGRKMFQTWEQMISMIESGLDITPVITHHFPIQDFEKAFKLIQIGEAGKVLLHW